MLFSFMILCLHLYHLLGLALLHLLSEPPPLSSKKQFKCSLLYAPCSLYLCICTCMLLFPMLSSKWIANIYWVLILCQACPWCFTCISSFNSMTYMLFLALLFQGENWGAEKLSDVLGRAGALAPGTVRVLTTLEGKKECLKWTNGLIPVYLTPFHSKKILPLEGYSEYKYLEN